ncbi:fibronectin type III domain protein, partial [Ostertagia ostertagi]
MHCRHLLLLALWALVLSAQELVPTATVDDLQGDLQIQEWMRELRRVKRAPTRNVHPIVVVLPGFDAALSSPPIPPPDAGKCIISKASGREICYPQYEDLDTTCTDVTGRSTSGLVAPPVIPHATVRAMAFVPPDNLRRLIVQYYRQQGKLMPKNVTFSPKSFLFVKYHCDFGYEMVDEIDTLFCHQKTWVNTLPMCRGKRLNRFQRLCADLWLAVLARRSIAISTHVHVRKELNAYGTTKTLCRTSGPYEVPPGGNINITCSAVAYPFPDIFWRVEYHVKKLGDEKIHHMPAKAGTVKNEQILIIKSYLKMPKFTCHANNSEGKVDRTIKVIITEPNHSAVIENLRPNTPYFIRLRANDQMGPGRLGNPAVAARPLVFIEQGEELLVGPLKPFELGCNITRADPVPIVTWQHKGRPLNNGERTMFMKMHIGGIIENTIFACVAENEAGKSTKRINITVTGPTAPERIRYQVDGDKVNLQWEQPRIINAPMAGYDILYTDNPSLPEEQWQIERIDDPLAHTATITGLKERTPYTFRIRGRNRLGEGLLSGPFNATTWLGGEFCSCPPCYTNLPNRASNEPLSIECEALGVPKPRIIWLWSGQLVEDGKDEFRVYTSHQWTLKTAQQANSLPKAPRELAVNAEGSDETKTEVKILGPGSAPLHIQPTPMHTGFDVAWQPPKRPNGRIKVRAVTIIHAGKPLSIGAFFRNYIVYYTKDPDAPLSEWKSETVSGDLRNLTVRVDDEDTPYVVKVQAATDDGPGIISEAYEMCGRRTSDAKRFLQLVADELHRKRRSRPPHVTVTPADKIVKEPSNEPLSIECEALGVPKPRIIWLWSGQLVEDGKDEFRVYDITPMDAQDRSTSKLIAQSTTRTGVATCQAVNAEGSDETKTEVKILGPGSAPLHIQPTPMHTGFDVAWQPPKRPNGRIKNYIVYYTKDPDAPLSEWKSETVSGDLSLSQMNAYVKNDIFQEPVPIPIHPDPAQEHRYNSIQVYSTTSTKRTLLCQARNPDGTVEDKHFFIVNKPGSPPRDVNVIVDPDNRVTVTWEPPKHPNGDITVGKTLSRSTIVWARPLDSQQVTIAECDARLISYRFVAEATTGRTPSTSAGFGSEERYMEPTLRYYIEEVSRLQYLAYTIYFTPDDGTADEDYRNWARIEVPTSDDHGNVIIDKDQYDIKPNTPYKVRISATNDQSEGPASEPTLFETGSGGMCQQIKCPPTITLDPPKNVVSVEPKGSVNIICTATGLPQPTVYWVLENGDKVEGRALQLTNLIKDTTATCRAENRAGMTQEVVQVQVAGPGTPPNEIVLLPMPNQVINVEWTTPDEVNGRITNYVVHYGEVPEGSIDVNSRKSANTSDFLPVLMLPTSDMVGSELGENEPLEWKQATVDAVDVNHQLPNLDPKKTYAVRVQAISDRGPGVISAPQMIRTLPLAPAKVENPEITVFNNNSIVIDFVPPADPDKPKKQIKDFVIQYTSEDPPTDETEWKELRYTDPDDTDNYTLLCHRKPEFNVDAPDNVIRVPAGTDYIVTFIMPSQPEFNVDAPDNVIRVPAGTDYIVTCSSTGFPPPDIRWVDSEGNQLSDGPQLKLIDVRRTIKAKCLAENRGGLKETDFTVFVAGEEHQDKNYRAGNCTRKRPASRGQTSNHIGTVGSSIDSEWKYSPKYIVYYTPLDDQDPAHQIGQVQSRPINEWVTYHDTPDTDGTRKAELKDFVETDTAYAVV